MYPTRLSLPQEKHYEVGFLFDRFCYSSGLFYGEQRGTNEYFSATNVKDLHPAKEYFMRQFKREYINSFIQQETSNLVPHIVSAKWSIKEPSPFSCVWLGRPERHQSHEKYNTTPPAGDGPRDHLVSFYKIWIHLIATHIPLYIESTKAVPTTVHHFSSSFETKDWKPWLLNFLAPSGTAILQPKK